MWALSRPVLVHWATNSRCERRAIARVTNSDNGTVSNVITRQQRRDGHHHRQHGHHGQHRREQLADRHRQRRLDVVDVVGDPAQQLTALAAVEVGQRQPVHLVLDVGAQRDHGALHGDVEQPGLRPNQQRGNQIQGQRQRQGSGHRAEVHAAAGHHVHPGQQVGEGVVAAGPGRGDGLRLGDSGGELPADDAVEQQVGGVAEDPRDDDPDRRAGDAQRDHRDAQPPLRRKPFRPAGPPNPRSRGTAWPWGLGLASRLPPRVVATVMACPALRRPPTASRRIPRRWRSRPAAIRACPNPPASRRRRRSLGRPGRRSKCVG